jgi:hypothetical protein
MSWLRFPAAPPALAAAAADRGRIKKRAGLPKLLHKLFIKVLCLRPPEEPMTMSAAFEAACYGYRMGMMGADDEQEYCYGYGSSWAGMLSSIPEEEVDDSSEDQEEGSPRPTRSGSPSSACPSPVDATVEVLL